MKAPKKSIKTMRKVVRYHKLAYDIDSKTEKDLRGMMADIKEAIEKQIPAKPVKRGREYFCPVCDEFVGSDYCIDIDGSQARYEKNYCEECGKAIDWEEK